MLLSNPVHCERITHAGGYDELIVYKSSRQAVDSLFSHLHDLFESVPPGVTLRFMMDMSQTKDMPMNHVFPHIRDLIKNGQKPTRAAILTRPSIIPGIISTMMNAMGLTKTQVHFFDSSQREEAVAWLLQNDE